MRTLTKEDAEAGAAEIVPPAPEGAWDWPYTAARRLIAAVLAAEFAAGRDGSNCRTIIEGTDPRGVPLDIQPERDTELLAAIKGTPAESLADDPRDLAVARMGAARALKGWWVKS